MVCNFYYNYQQLEYELNKELSRPELDSKFEDFCIKLLILIHDHMSGKVTLTSDRETKTYPNSFFIKINRL